MECAVCGKGPRSQGVLCEECRDDLSMPVHIAPEQVVSSANRPTPAALVDLWGRTHALDHRTLIGRGVEGSGVSVLDTLISRHHAHIAYEPNKTAWVLRDLGSSNGTWYNDQQVAESVTLRHGDRVTIGQVGFYFLERVIGPMPAPGPMSNLRGRTPTPTLPTGGQPLPQALAAMAALMHDAPHLPEFGDEENVTDVGLPELSVRMHEPTGGGGGVVEVSSRQVQLTTTQFELFALLVRRMVDESHQPELVRGFVRTSELIADLSWDTRDPGDNHVKQLVRRVRRALIKAGIGDLIESRHRFGYRLRVLPRLK